MFCGVDEAGRGSVMGPLVVGAVYIENDDILKKIGVKDSKKLTPEVRKRMYCEIMSSASDYSIVKISATDIDEKRLSGLSLNDIELNMFHEATSKIPVTKVYADCFYVNEIRFSTKLSKLLENVVVRGRHKADDIYPVVSAASIIAKVERDHIIEEISKELGENIGSGYPSDPRTMNFIKKWINDNGVLPPHTRNSWQPVRNMLSISANTKITDW